MSLCMKQHYNVTSIDGRSQDSLKGMFYSNFSSYYITK